MFGRVRVGPTRATGKLLMSWGHCIVLMLSPFALGNESIENATRPGVGLYEVAFGLARPGRRGSCC